MVPRFKVKWHTLLPGSVESLFMKLSKKALKSYKKTVCIQNDFPLNLCSTWLYFYILN